MDREPTVLRTHRVLGREVRGPDGSVVGHVVDIAAVQDGPLRDGTTAAVRIDGLVVGPHGMAHRLGLQRHLVHGPWLLKRLAWLGAPCRFLPWDQVVDPRALAQGDDPLRFRGDLADLDRA